jgi:hypothetical protein
MATTKRPYAEPTLDVISFGKDDVILTSNYMDDDGWTQGGKLRTRIKDWNESGILNDDEN